MFLSLSPLIYAFPQVYQFHHFFQNANILDLLISLLYSYFVFY